MNDFKKELIEMFQSPGSRLALCTHTILCILTMLTIVVVQMNWPVIIIAGLFILALIMVATAVTIASVWWWQTRRD